MLKKMIFGTSIILLFIQTGGWLIALMIHAKMNSIRQEEKLNTDGQGQKIQLSASDFFQYRINHKEIRIHNRLHDYQVLHQSAESVTLLIIEDEKEEDILEAVSHFFGEATSSAKNKKELPKKWIQWLQTAFIVPEVYILTFIYKAEESLYGGEIYQKAQWKAEVSPYPPNSHCSLI